MSEELKACPLAEVKMVIKDLLNDCEFEQLPNQQRVEYLTKWLQEKTPDYQSRCEAAERDVANLLSANQILREAVTANTISRQSAERERDELRRQVQTLKDDKHPRCTSFKCQNAKLIYMTVDDTRQTENGFLICSINGWYCPVCMGGYGDFEV